MASSHYSNEYPEWAYLDPNKGVHMSDWASVPATISRVFIFDEKLSLKEKLVYVLINNILDNVKYGGKFYDWTDWSEENADSLEMPLEEYTSALRKLHDLGYITLTDRETPESPTAKEVAERELEELGRSFHLSNYLKRQEELSRQESEKEPVNRRKSIGASLRLAVYKADKYRCVQCGSNEDLTVDHIFPVSLGGTNDRENLQTLCHSCNSRKGAKWDGDDK